MVDKNRIKIFDTTLRDGEQSPGASLNEDEKIEIAKQLARLKVDVIEAGFPIASPGDFEAVKRIAREVKGPAIAGLARARKIDIERAYEAVKYSDRPRIHTFIATSPIHMERKLGLTPDQVIEQAVEAVKFAKSLCNDVEFSAEDAGRSDPEFLYKIFTEVIKAGATVINVPDTVGYTQPEEFGALIRGIGENVEGVENVDISVHCHNDLGLATANSLAGVLNGATQVECTINGIGERAGNASLEEIVMNLVTRKDYFQKEIGIDTTQLYPASRLVSRLTGFVVQPNKAIVGANAFAHEAGIHQDGVIKDKRTYEIMTPESVGFPGTKLVLGKHSGRHALYERLKELGYDLTNEQLNLIFSRFKELADKKKEVLVEDLEAILTEEILPKVPEKYSLEYFQVVTGSTTIPVATLEIAEENGLLRDASIGNGPVDAVFKAIERVTGIKARLTNYVIKAITGSKDAQGEVSLELEIEGKTYSGKGVSTDIIEASAKAYINALNRYFVK